MPENGENGTREQAIEVEMHAVSSTKESEKVEGHAGMHPRTRDQIMRIRAVILIQRHARAWLKRKQAQKQPKLADEKELAERLEAWEASVKFAKAEQDVNKYWTQSQKFSIGIGVIVMINAVTLGIEADFHDSNPTLFYILENIFTSVFTVEIICHFYVEGPRIYFQDRMNWLDFTLVCFSILDVWILGALNVDADLKIMSIFRMLRLVRLGRLLRLFRIFKELTLILTGFLASVRTLFWALSFLLIIVYIFAIFARQIIGFKAKCGTDASGNVGECSEHEPGAEHFYWFNPEIGDQGSLFGGVDRTMLTLFVCLTDGCGIDVVHPTVLRTPWLIGFWITFVFLTTFGLLNLIVGLFCENAIATAAANEQAILASRDAQRRKTLKALRQAFVEMDTDNSGSISKLEYTEAILENDDVMTSLEILGLDEEENLFETLDADKSGIITFDQFFDGAMLIMKGHESAKAKDMVGVHLLCQSLARRCNKLHELHKMIMEQREATSTAMMVVQARNKDNMRCVKNMSEHIVTLANEIAVIKKAIVNNKDLSGESFSDDGFDRPTSKDAE